jgi:hypothetical protein
MEHVLRNALYALLERDGSSLRDILVLFDDDKFRKKLSGAFVMRSSGTSGSRNSRTIRRAFERKPARRSRTSLAPCLPIRCSGESWPNPQSICISAG